MESGSGNRCRMTPYEIIAHYRKNDSFSGLKFFAYGINALLRNSGVLSTDQAEAVRLLDVAIAASALSESPRIFFRGCSEEDFLLCERGEEFRCQSFLSLSSNPLEAAFFAKNYEGQPSYLLMVLIPAGTRLLRISDDSTGSLEKDEWLPARGLRFRSYPWDGTSGVGGVGPK